ncbi:MAG TPA: aminotransferase class V-fold PLP-dependent enzyme [Gaiellales bacterium]
MHKHMFDPAIRATPRLVGQEQRVPTADGALRRSINLDHAASTPPLVAVREAVDRFVPWYSSIHRGAGYRSQVASRAYEGARAAVADFVDADDDQVVVLVRNTTEALNVLARALPPGLRVLCSSMEHHANLLPWRAHRLEMLPFPDDPAALLETAAATLAGPHPFDLLVVTAASNVTGEVWPIEQLAELAHAHGARIVVDGAQLAPHRPVRMREWGIDFLALSGHKLYAPYGAGALIARRDAIADGVPLLQGGGAVQRVTLDDVVWSDLPDRYEAGSPNVIGAVALGVACDTLAAFGMEELAAHERPLVQRLRAGLRTVPGVQLLDAWQDESIDRLGVCTFTVAGQDHRLVAAALSAEHAIAVRSGAFCAHPLVAHLLGLAPELPSAQVPPDRPTGAVRVSLGLGVDEQQIDAFLAAVGSLAAAGPRLAYAPDAVTRQLVPRDDARDWPELGIRLSGARRGSGAPCL